jgi:hypothetical protein
MQNRQRYCANVNDPLGTFYVLFKPLFLPYCGATCIQNKRDIKLKRTKMYSNEMFRFSIKLAD